MQPRTAANPRHRSAESGQVLILVAVSLTALLAIGVLAVDAGLLRVAHGRLQGTADAAALAGAVGLRNLGAAGALRCARQVVHASRPGTAGPQLTDPIPVDLQCSGPRRVQVALARTPASGNGVRTVFTPALGLTPERSVRALAGAETVELCAADGFRPLAIPDRWRDSNGNGTYDAGEFYAPETTGYRPRRDEGLVLELEPYAPAGAAPPTLASYLRVRLPAIDGGQGSPRQGADSYRRFLRRGAPFAVACGQHLELETEAVAQHTAEILSRLLARDRHAHWQPREMAVVGGSRGLSPRVVKVLLVDPRSLPTGAPGNSAGLLVSRLAAGLIEQVGRDGRLTLRLVPLAGAGTICPAGTDSFLYRPRLVPRLPMVAQVSSDHRSRSSHDPQ